MSWFGSRGEVEGDDGGDVGGRGGEAEVIMVVKWKRYKRMRSNGEGCGDGFIA